MVPDNAVVIGRKNPERVGTGSDFHAQCQVGIYIILSLDQRLVIFQYDGVESKYLKTSPEIDGGIGIVVPLRHCIKIDKGRGSLEADLVSYTGRNDQLVQEGHAVGKLVIFFGTKIFVVAGIQHGEHTVWGLTLGTLRNFARVLGRELPRPRGPLLG